MSQSPQSAPQQSELSLPSRFQTQLGPGKQRPIGRAVMERLPAAHAAIHAARRRIVPTSRTTSRFQSGNKSDVLQLALNRSRRGSELINVLFPLNQRAIAP